jgi:Recombination endonuclease VII
MKQYDFWNGTTEPVSIRSSKCGFDVGQKRAACRANYYKNRDKHLALVQQYQQKNPDKTKVWRKTYREKNLGKCNAYVRRWVLKKKYGLTQEGWDKAFALQNGECAICGTSDFSKHPPATDHDHITGRFRGILCSACNKGLGSFKDSPEILIKAAEYLYQNGQGAANGHKWILH